jgi:hypothetical protein
MSAETEYYAKWSGKHCMQVILERAAKFALTRLTIPTTEGAKLEAKRAKAEKKPWGLFLFGVRLNITKDEGDVRVNGLRLSEWLKTGITEEQAKSVMLLRGGDVLKKCSWEELWGAYRK